MSKFKFPISSSGLIWFYPFMAPSSTLDKEGTVTYTKTDPPLGTGKLKTFSNAINQ